MNPTSWLQRQALLHPKRPAFFWNEESWSFSCLAQVAQRYAHYYAHQLPADCQRVAVFSTNTPELYFTILGLWELGIEIQFLNHRLSASELRFQLEDAQTTCVITNTPESFDTLALILAIPVNLTVPIREEEYFDDGYQDTQCASIMYTSGTTGQPKGVPQTFANHLASAKATQHSLMLTKDDCWGLCLPLFHISGLSILLRSMSLGIQVRFYLQPDVQRLAADLTKGKLTIVSVVTRLLNEWLPLVPKEGYKSLRTVLLGGGPVDAQTLKEAEEKHLPVMQSFGMTETCSQIVALPFVYAAEKLGSAGFPLVSVQVRIQKKMDAEKVGEIYVKGPSIVTRYLNNRSSDQWTTDGWLKTGDLGYLDEEGALYLVSRMSELIISGGENIYPAEIEQALIQHPALTEAAVVGQKNADWGQVPVAYICIAREVSLMDIYNHLEKKIAKYKYPKEIYVVHELPKTASGKPLKRQFLTEERVNYIDYQLS